jgi:uncharacterized membrane protein
LSGISELFVYKGTFDSLPIHIAKMGPAMPLVDRSLAVFLVSIIIMSISVIAVSLRSFVRLSIVRAFGWDDGLMVAALVSYLLPWHEDCLLIL